MKNINTFMLLTAAFVAVFLQAALAGLRHILGAPVNLLPALIVFAALYGGLRAVSLLAVCGGFWFDSFSANPLGISVLPLFVVGFLIYRQRELILRDRGFAQFVLGLAASFFVPLLTLLMLFSMGQTPLVGWGTLWQFVVLSVLGGACTPLAFRFFQRLRHVFFHPPMAQISFRLDREIHRGRR
jgi:rod shape-determining protein MreD